MAKGVSQHVIIGSLMGKSKQDYYNVECIYRSWYMININVSNEFFKRQINTEV